MTLRAKNKKSTTGKNPIQMRNRINDQELLRNLLQCEGAFIYIHDHRLNETIFTTGNFNETFGFHTINQITHFPDLELFHCHPDDKSILKSRNEGFRSGAFNTWLGLIRFLQENREPVWLYSQHCVFDRLPGGEPAMQGGLFINISNIGKLRSNFHEFIHSISSQCHKTHLDGLTKREIQLIRLIAGGMNYGKIAELLCISPNTVNTHRKNVLRKLGLHNIAALIQYANDKGLL